MVVPDEAETVRTIFRCYLDLGSMGALIEDLDRRGIRTKAVARLDGRVRGGIRFGVGPLAHLLKNRFYLGEVVYRGEVHAGEHEPILDRDLFAAVQEKLAANAVARKVRLRGSASILTGRIYDDRGNRMSPTHSNKLGVRYRYYVSHALLQSRKGEAGSVARVPAPEIEQLVVDGIRGRLQSAEPSAAAADRDLVDIVHEPAAKPTMNPETRDALLAAIAKARSWIEDLRLGRVATLAEIADREALGERHVRLLAPLAFVSPAVVAAIAEGTAPTDLTVTGLAQRLPYSWANQERRLGTANS